jgi:hypothetical protein
MPPFEVEADSRVFEEIETRMLSACLCLTCAIFSSISCSSIVNIRNKRQIPLSVPIPSSISVVGISLDL